MNEENSCGPKALGPAVLGLIRRDISGVDERRDQLLIREISTVRGYFVVQLTVAVTAVGTAALLTAEHIRAGDVVAVIVPGLAHVEPFARAITELCDLITPEKTYPRGYRWPSLLPGDHPYRRLP
ncbi:hypothetical protein [Nocardia niwae]|uniref:Uncharacterized protein n=1 Tax=Nocardia niwae TaxID=626084 RepID=A0ABV2XHR8_9NOCA